MIIELINGVNWDTDLQPSEQTMEALTWVAMQMQPIISNSNNVEGIKPELDEQNRPVKWVIPMNDFTITRSINYTGDNQVVSLTIEKNL